MLSLRQYPSDTPESFRRAEAMLLAAGAHFELENIDSPFGPLPAFKNRPHSLVQILEQARGFGDREALVYDDGQDCLRWSFTEFLVRIDRFAAVLRDEFGIAKGDRVAILAPNRPEWLLAFWATVRLGGIAVGMNAWWTGAEIDFVLADCRPKLLIGDAKRLARIPGLAPCPILDMDANMASLMAEEGSAQAKSAVIDENDPAAILYTSGTTGRAKGVIQTHRNMCSLGMCNFFHGARIGLAAALEAGIAPVPPPPATVLVTSPLFHVSGLHNAAVTCLAGGTKTVWLGGKFEPERVLKLIEQERITSWGYTETLLRRLLASPKLNDYDLSSIKILGGGGSNIAPALQQAAREAIPTVKTTFGVGYGQTECGSLATLNPGPELLQHPTSVGRPVPTVEIDIRNEGEIYVRSPLTMPGYWNNPAATAEILSADGWLNTGDWGRIDNGRLYMDSRKRDLIIRGGENIYPAEIESRLLEHPDVAEAAVIGVDSEEYGQEVKAIVVPHLERSLNIELLQRFTAETLAYYKVPRHWEIRREALPRNATGKVLKHALST